MSKMKLVNEVVEQAKAAIDSLEELIKTLEKGLTDKAENVDSVKERETEKTYSLEEVRAELADVSRAGFTDEVRELIVKHGASKLSEIDPSKYADIIKDAKVIGND